jgi:hypothetical protein
MTIFNYTDFDLINPSGANGLSSYAMYYQRLLYKEEIYPSNLFSPLDTWYNKQYYGRVDQLQNTIIPDPSDLKMIKTATRQNLMALNFVVESFEKFSSHMKNANILGVLRPDGNPKILDMKAHNGFVDPTNLYNSYLQQVYESFRKNLLLKNNNEITGFKTFTKQYLAYLRMVAEHIPVTKTNYLLTGITSVMNSGLSIAIDGGRADNDSYKYENFINDPNYRFYVRSAKKFGFIVNKNIPWILTADLFSNSLLKNLANYVNDAGQEINKNNFFQSYYKQTHFTDIENLKTFIINSYNFFVQRNPIYQRNYGAPGCDKFNVANVWRDPLPPNVNEILSDKVMIDLYLDLRNIEAKKPIQITKKLKTELANIYNIQPNKQISKEQNAADYINLIFRDYIYSTDYLTLNSFLTNNLDNQLRSGKIATAGSITQQLF